jgi:hypothetical protein
MVVHVYNPSYLGGRKQDCSLRQTWAKGAEGIAQVDTNAC